MRAGVELMPVAITCRPRTLMKGQRWYDVPDRAFDLTLRVLPPLAPKEVLAGGRDAVVAARKLTDALRERLLDALADGGHPVSDVPPGSSSPRSARSARSAR